MAATNLLLSLAKAIGLLDDSGFPVLGWFKDPLGQTRKIHDPIKPLDLTRRKHLREALTGLLAQEEAKGTLPLPEGRWYRVHKDVPLDILLGADDKRELVGAGGRYLGKDGSVQLYAYSWLLGLDTSWFSALTPPAIKVGGQLAWKTGVLKQLALGGHITPGGADPVAITIDLLDREDAKATCRLSAAEWTSASTWKKSLTDSIGLALFLIKALTPKGKIKTHFFPLFGEKKPGTDTYLIPPFPLSTFTDGPARLLEWLRSLLPAQLPKKGEFPKINVDPIAAILYHLRGLLSSPNEPDNSQIKGGSWIAELPGGAGLKISYDPALSFNLGLALFGQKTATIQSQPLRLSVEADLFQANLDPKLTLPTLPTLPDATFNLSQFKAQVGTTFRGPQDVSLRLELLPQGDEATGFLLDLTQYPELQPLHPLKVWKAAVGLRMSAGGSLAPFWEVLLRDAAGNVQTLPSDSTLRQSVINRVVDQIGQLSATVQGVLRQVQAVASLTLQSVTKAVTSLFSQLDFGSYLGLALGPDANLKYGVWLTPKTDIGISGSFGAFESGGSYGGALSLSVDLDKLLALQSLGLGAKLSLSLSSAGGSVGIGAELELAGIQLSKLWEDPLKSITTLIKGLALPLVMQVLSDAEFLTETIIQQSSLTLGQILHAVGLGTWDATAKKLTQRPLKDLLALAPFPTLAEGLKAILGNRSFKTGDLSWTLSAGSGGYGVKLGAVPGLISVDGVSVGWDAIQIDLIKPVNGQLQPAPQLALTNLKVVAEGPGGLPLIDLSDPSLSLQLAQLTTSLTVGGSAGFQLDKVALKVKDLRLPLGAAAEIIGQLLPKTGKDNAGITFDVSWERSQTPSFKLSFDGKPRLELPLDRQIGPLDLKGLILSTQTVNSDPGIALKFDGRFYLGGIAITPDGLGITIPLKYLTKPEPKQWGFTLDGLGLLFNQGGVLVTGMLRRKTEKDSQGNEISKFQGAALVRAFGFQLGALGAYEQMASEKPSMFIFAALRAPLGGPPFFFVTGVAAGMGYNRLLKVPTTPVGIASLPFFELMRGDMDLSKVQEIGAKIDKYLDQSPGTVWLAGGVTFTSFQLINGEALVYMVFGRYVEIGVVAMARFVVEHICFVELALLARFTTEGNDPNFLVIGGLTHNSWLLTEGCRLHGGFAFQVWFNSGDCVLTIGGYHPRPPQPLPERYPKVDRVGFDMTLANVVVKGAAYFALTPREAMGGASLEVSGQWGPLFAGFTAYFDALIAWDPFFFMLDMGVEVYCGLDTWLGRVKLSLGVELHLYGPPIGGRAHVKVLFLSIDIPFGHELPPRSSALLVGEYLKKALGLTAQSAAGNTISLPGRSVTDGAGEVQKPGLFSVEVDRGLFSKKGEPPDGSGAKPFLLLPEFRLRLRSRIPVRKFIVGSTLELMSAPGEPKADEPFYFAHCRSEALESWMNVAQVGGIPKKKVPVVPLFADQPEGLFGKTDKSGKPLSARQVERRCVGLTIDGQPSWDQALPGDHRIAEEYALPSEELALPLGLPAEPLTYAAFDKTSPRLSAAQLTQLGVLTRYEARCMLPRLMPRSAGVRSAGAVVNVYPVGTKAASPQKLLSYAAGRRGLLMSAALFAAPRVVSVRRLDTTLPGEPDDFAHLPRVPAPKLVARIPALAAVQLRLEAARPQAAGSRVHVRRPDDRDPDSAARLRELDVALRRSAVRLAPGSGILLASELPVARKTQLLLESEERARILCLGHTARPLLDRVFSSGEHTTRLPQGTERMFVFAGGARAAGFEPGTTLYALGGGCYAGPGCTLAVQDARRIAGEPQAVTARALLDRAAQVELWLTQQPLYRSDRAKRVGLAESGNKTLILRLKVGDRGLHKSVQWKGGRRLPAPFVILHGEEALLLYKLQRPPRSLPVWLSLASGWCLRGAALREGSVELHARALATDPALLIEEDLRVGGVRIRMQDVREVSR